MIGIRKLRKARGWTQRRLAAELEITEASVWQMETGKIIPSGKTIMKLEEIFDVRCADLFERCDEPPKAKKPSDTKRQKRSAESAQDEALEKNEPRSHIPDFKPGAKYVFIRYAKDDWSATGEYIDNNKKKCELTFVSVTKTRTATMYVFRKNGGATETFTEHQLRDVAEIREV